MPEEELRRLAAFRMLLRQFQSFSEQAAGAQGLTSPQYQALLAIKAHQEDGPMTVTILAQRLLVKHNSAVGLVDRIEQLGLIARQPSASDRRSVVVALTAQGKRVLNRVAVLHRRELQRIAPELGRHASHFAAAAPDGA
ncbi:MAG: MarR family transcriptional regulator [Pseudomonadota bacterium]